MRPPAVRDEKTEERFLTGVRTADVAMAAGGVGRGAGAVAKDS